MPKFRPIPIRFNEKIDKSGDCWLWIGACNKDGYGQLLVDRKPKSAHRIAWELENGTIPDGMSVCHKCDTRNCVRPDHLFIGTHGDNIRDCYRKKRHPCVKGEYNADRNPSAVLTWDQVREIRCNNTDSHSSLGRRYGVSHQTIRAVRLGMTWKEDSNKFPDHMLDDIQFMEHKMDIS